MKLLKNIPHKLSAATLAVYVSTATWAQTNIERPDFVNDANVSDVADAGNEIYGWIIAYAVIFIAIMAIFPGLKMIQGKQDEAMDLGKNILIGGALIAVLGGVVFAVIGFFN